MVRKYALICAMEIQKIHMVVHTFSGFALYTESECIAELNPSASCWPLTRCILIYQQTGANQNTVHLKTGLIWKFIREWILWTGCTRGGSLRKKPQSPTQCQLWSIGRKISHRCARNFRCSQTGCLTTLFVKNKPRKLVSSLVGCLLLFLKIYVLKIGGNCGGKYWGNGKIEISVF